VDHGTKPLLNSNGKLEIRQPVTALKFLLRYDQRHFAKSNCLLVSMRGSVTILKT
jgi:hypothetical protein